MKRKAATPLNQTQYIKKPKIKKSLSLVNPPHASTSSIEKKNIDITTSFALPAYGTWSGQNLLNALAQGAGSSSRIGRKVSMRSFLMRYSLQQPAQLPSLQARILIVYDKQCNGAIPAITDILNGSTAEAVNNLDKSDRFITLVDYVTPEPGSNNAGDAAAQTFLYPAIYRKLNLETMYSGTAGTFAEIVTGALWLFVHSSESTGTAQMFMSTRVRYTDQ